MVDVDSSYNEILETPFHAGFDLVISMSHQQVKFNTLQGVRFVRSSPLSLLGHKMKIKRKRDEVTVEAEINSITTNYDRRIQWIFEKQISNFVLEVSQKEEFDEVIINPAYRQQHIKIGQDMPNSLREDIIEFLKKSTRLCLVHGGHAGYRYFGR